MCPRTSSCRSDQQAWNGEAQPVDLSSSASLVLCVLCTCSRQLRGELTVPPSLPKHELAVPEAAQLTGVWGLHGGIQPRLRKPYPTVALGSRVAQPLAAGLTAPWLPPSEALSCCVAQACFEHTALVSQPLPVRGFLLIPSCIFLIC